MTPSQYARELLHSLGRGACVLPAEDHRSAAALWADSGALWLSGHPHEPPRACPAPLAACARGAWLALCALAPGRLATDFPAGRLLGERAAIAGLSRRGRTSAGGACHLLDTADGVLAVNLAREEDFELLPAWVEASVEHLDQLVPLLRSRATDELVERARLLGLAVAPAGPPPLVADWLAVELCAPSAPPPADGCTPLVVDLSALWAGPLCGQLLMQAGARVIKVESTRRPDGARLGPAALFDLLNARKESVALDFRSPDDLAALRALLARADIVIEAARPRALEQLGIRAGDVLAADPGKVWVSITGYGRSAPQRDWIAYGDDAGVAAGLAWLMGGDRGDPVFAGDAIADPLTGLHAALAALAWWQRGGGVLLDVALTRVVGWCIAAGTVTPSDDIDTVPAAQPVARQPAATAAPLGADTDRVLGELLARG